MVATHKPPSRSRSIADGGTGLIVGGAGWASSVLPSVNRARPSGMPKRSAPSCSANAMDPFT